MGKGVVVFVVVWLLVAAGIQGFRSLSGQEKWSLIKTVLHAAAFAAIALVVVGGMVVMF